MSALGHCLHHDGEGTTMGDYGGSDRMTCCYCGETFDVAFRTLTRAIKGHGPHVRETYAQQFFPGGRWGGKE